MKSGSRESLEHTFTGNIKGICEHTIVPGVRKFQHFRIDFYFLFSIFFYNTKQRFHKMCWLFDSDFPSSKLYIVQQPTHIDESFTAATQHIELNGIANDN